MADIEMPARGPDGDAVSTDQLVGWLRAWDLPLGPVVPLAINAVAPGLVVDGPAPELEQQVRELHRRLHGIPEGCWPADEPADEAARVSIRRSDAGDSERHAAVAGCGSVLDRAETQGSP